MGIRSGALVDVLPYLSPNDGLHVAGSYTVLTTNAGKLAVRTGVLFAYGANYILRKGCAVVLFPLGVIAAPLCLSVLAVVHIGAKKQMLRVAARWIVAFVQDALILWNDAINKRPNKPVHKPLLAPKTKRSVTIWNLTSSPNYAAAGAFLCSCPNILNAAIVGSFAIYKVRWVNTAINATRMAYRYQRGFFGEQPSKTMRSNLLTLPPDKATPVAVCASVPHPAFFCFCYALPKVFSGLNSAVESNNLCDWSTHRGFGDLAPLTVV